MSDQIQHSEMEVFLSDLNEKTLGAYELRRSLLNEHQGIEESVLAGGYGYRQILELIQNGADAILEAHEEGGREDGRIEVLLTDSHLYVANTGASVSKEGVDALLTSHNSPKRGNQIGRFGLGFKSLLRLGGTIDLFSSRWGGIRFDPGECRNEIKKRFGVDDAPGLRLAWSLSNQERFEDSLVGRLSWAETIVRVEIVDPELVSPLRAEILEFPAEFLLFNPIPIELKLDVGEGNSRTLLVKGRGETRELVEGEKRSKWHLFQRDVPVKDEAAKADATHIHARKSVPLAWAVPVLGRREEAGRFWAFFPTKTPTYVPGVLNAPWKLNNDRQGLIPGAWNEMLMREAALLVTESVMSLSEVNDPAKHLDFFPRRPSAGDVAIPLLEAIWSSLESESVIPDCRGKLRRGFELSGHPTGESDLLSTWMDLADEETLAAFVHPSCLRRERRGRLNALSERLAEKNEEEKHPCCGKSEWREWIAMVASRDEVLVKKVLSLISEVRRHCVTETWEETRPSLKVILDREGELRVPAEVMIGPEADLPPDVHAIADCLLEDPQALKVLTETMEVAQLEDGVWVKRLDEALSNARSSYWDDSKWREFWKLVQSSPHDVALDFITKKKRLIKVANREEEWATPREVLLPGRLVEEGDEENDHALVNASLHGEDLDFLVAAGVTDLPDGQTRIHGDWDGQVDGAPLLECFSTWLNSTRDRYQESHQNSARRSYLSPKYQVAFPNGWHFLSQLQGEPAAKLTRTFMKWLESDEFPDEIVFGHISQSRYGTINVEHPILWLLLNYGEFQIGMHFVSLSALLDEANKEWIAEIPEFVGFQGAFGKLLKLHEPGSATIEERQSFWSAVCEVLIPDQNLQESWISEIWNGAAEVGGCPLEFRMSQKTIPVSEVYVTTSRELAERVRSEDQLVFVMTPTAVELWTENGAQALSDGLRPSWEEVRPGVSLIEVFPELQSVLSEEVSQNGVGVRVVGLVMKFNDVSTAIPCLLQASTLYFDGETLDRMNLMERYEAVLKELGNAGALNCSLDEALSQLVDAEVEARRDEVFAAEALESKLLLAVGSNKGPLCQVLGSMGEQSFISKCSLDDLARVVLGHFGPSVLSALSETLKAEGLAPPSRWGTAEAREFVRQLGFPEEFGAARSARREPEEWSQGPFPLPPLHDFQVEVRDGIKTMMDREESGRRAVISLPTGGGKTRVTVESAVEFTLKPESPRRGVLWIAQTDELCEQAVQSFRQVWPNRGAEKTELRIIRMWGGNPTPIMPSEGEAFVVVASIQTLDARGGIHGGEWAARFGMLVIDECHHAITPSYTRLFRWLGFDARTNEEEPNPELVILGLSATPFRMDDEESKRLASRFSKRWFPHNQESLHKLLLNQRVLCRVTSEELHSGTGLSSSEEEDLDQLGDLEGFEFEKMLERINQRLGDHGGRNRQLVERIQKCDEQSILFFANSVSHSCEMAARLNLAGIPAAAVSGETSRSARRYFLEQFQKGELRVLCNHSVLTTGFDAPKTDMLLIARQVFSPVRYMQMVGRGLRGVKNGGTEHCRIVTVLDNLGRFQDRHPYHYCRQHFESCES